jgi:hypothetical protein
MTRYQEELWSPLYFYKVQDTLTYSFTQGLIFLQQPLSITLYKRIQSILSEHTIHETPEGIFIDILSPRSDLDIDDFEWINGFLVANGTLYDNDTIITPYNFNLKLLLEKLNIRFIMDDYTIYISFNDAPSILLIRTLLNEKQI